jgi:peptidoglycan glycosyltransferase
MDRSIRRVGVFLMLLFCALFAQLNYIQVIDAPALNEKPSNSRPIDEAFSQPRGTVTTADGVIIARSVPIDSKKKYQREFPEGDLYAQITGYFNYSFGATGLESAYNAELSGQTPEQQVQDVGDLFRDSDSSGNLELSVRSDVQKAARNALGEQRGSVVALDPRSGQVLALWSYPSFDPNVLSDHDIEEASKAKTFLENAPGNPLLAKVYREIYPPGSTFKIVTGTIGVETGTVTPTEPVYPTERAFTPPQTTRPLPNYGGSSCGGTLYVILAKSCNTAFARMGLEIGGPEMIEGSEAFGFNERPPFDLPAVASIFPDQDYSDTQPQLAQAAIGQGSVASTPLQMALAAAGIGNNGSVMRPHVVDRVLAQDGKVIDTLEPEVWTEATDAASAGTMREAMRHVVASGTATRLQIPGVDVGAKTGTAQFGSGDPLRSHAWVVAWAGPPGELPVVAVAVIVEGQDGLSELTGGRVAAPIARAVIEQALRPMPEPPPATPSSTTTSTPVPEGE